MDAGKEPQQIELSPSDCEALLVRLDKSDLPDQDRRMLAVLVRSYFQLVFVLKESKISIQRLKAMLFGPSKPKPAPVDVQDTPAALPVTGEPAAGGDSPTSPTPNRQPVPGHGRMSAQDYPGAQTVVYRHTHLNSGEPCPACLRGSLYTYPMSVRIRIDGSPLLTAQRHEVDNLRCSACGDVFPAVAPEDKYTEQAKAVMVYAHHELGVPLHRLSAMQANVGVPVAEATLWELTEHVVGCAYPVFQHLEVLGAQSGTIFQDDTPVRIQSLLKENKTLEKGQRVGMQTTGFGVRGGAHDHFILFRPFSCRGES